MKIKYSFLNILKSFTDVDCIDCVVDWGLWETCANGERARSTFVSIHPVGAGAGCPEVATEVEGMNPHCMI